VIGVVLTGANRDGSKGLAKFAARGGQVIVQDPANAEVDVMPAAARAEVPKARVADLEGIAAHLIRLAQLQRKEVAPQS
jgi:two-component system chemotaxis response regulator CheB